MELTHLIIILIIVVIASEMLSSKPSKMCRTLVTDTGAVIEICASHEDFDIPKEPKELCESRCQTNFDHAQLQARGTLVENCIKQCNNL